MKIKPGLTDLIESLIGGDAPDMLFMSKGAAEELSARLGIPIKKFKVVDTTTVQQNIFEEDNDEQNT